MLVEAGSESVQKGAKYFEGWLGQGVGEPEGPAAGYDLGCGVVVADGPLGAARKGVAGIAVQARFCS
jgi:hypothetical protein